MKLFILLFVCPVLLLAERIQPPDQDRPDFVRTRETEKATLLETALVTYQKDALTLDLIGAVHLADAAYYQRLNALFKNYEALLFELVGGENLQAELQKKEILEEEEEPLLPLPAGKEAEALPEEPGPPAGLDFLSTLFDKSARFLNLTLQLEEIDYSAPNFIHADVTLKEFHALQEQRNESLLTFMLQTSTQAPRNRATEPNSFRLLKGLLFRKPNLIKRELVGTLGTADDELAAVLGDSVIITDRNAKALRVLKEQMAKGHRKIGIFYGAGHFPDMEERLLKMGFQKVKTRWLPAWTIPKPPQRQD